ncbi:hypothetical protein B9Z40_01840 [Limnohabitans sp. 15K]|nr:hypothetical protein B9Z40_01840 [Limnohabitans sp. 15K]
MMNITTKDREIAMKTRHLTSSFAGLVLGLGLLAAPSASWAADNFTVVTPGDKPVKAKKPKQARTPKQPISTNTGESKGERDKRLLRECRGKANAGACEGYAS